MQPQRCEPPPQDPRALVSRPTAVAPACPCRRYAALQSVVMVLGTQALPLFLAVPNHHLQTRQLFAIVIYPLFREVPTPAPNDAFDRLTTIGGPSSNPRLRHALLA